MYLAFTGRYNFAYFYQIQLLAKHSSSFWDIRYLSKEFYLFKVRTEKGYITKNYLLFSEFLTNSTLYPQLFLELT